MEDVTLWRPGSLADTGIKWIRLWFEPRSQGGMINFKMSFRRDARTIVHEKQDDYPNEGTRWAHSPISKKEYAGIPPISKLLMVWMKLPLYPGRDQRRMWMAQAGSWGFGRRRERVFDASRISDEKSYHLSLPPSETQRITAWTVITWKLSVMKISF